MKLAKDYTQTYDSLHVDGRHRAQQDFRDVGVFSNPYTRHTPEWHGYHYIESKQFRIDLDNSHYQQESY